MAEDRNDYFPSARVTLIVRFDEFADVKDLKSKAPKKPAKNLKGTSDLRDVLEVQTDTEAPGGVNRVVLLPKSGSVEKIKGPQFAFNSTDGRTRAVKGLLPKSATLALNGVRQADTLQLTLKYIDMPIDPRTVRSCGVLFYLGTVRDWEFRDGVEGQVRPDGTPYNLIPEEWVDEEGNIRSNLRFQGWVDKWEVVFGEHGEPYVKIDCRDNTQLLIDTDAPPNHRITGNVKITDAIAKYLLVFPQMAGLSVEYRPNDTPESVIPILDSAMSKTAFPPKLGPPVAGGGGATGGEKLNVWDYLTDVVGSVGHTVRVEGNVIIIQQSRTLYSNRAGSATRRDDPFQGRIAEGQNFEYRRFIYGRNLQELKITRNMNKKAPTNIEARCYDPVNKTMIVGRYPSNAADFVAVGLPGDGGTDQKWMVIPVKGVKSKEALEVVAQTAFETIGRNEIAVELKTRNLASFGAGNLDPDILDMQAGDPFELLVNRDDGESGDELSTISLIEGFLVVQDRCEAFMKTLGFDAEFAKTYARAYSDSGFQKTFRTKEAKFEWSIDNGVSITVQGINYVEVRGDQLAAKAEEKAIADKKNPLPKPGAGPKPAAAATDADAHTAGVSKVPPVPGSELVSTGVTGIPTEFLPK